MSRIVTVVVTIAIWATVVLRPTFGQIFRNHTYGSVRRPLTEDSCTIATQFFCTFDINFIHL